MEDVLDWQDIPQCDNEGKFTTETCFDAASSELKISRTLQLAVYQMVMEKLGISFKLNEDMTNDSNSEIRI